jgi:hypothetical protein
MTDIVNSGEWRIAFAFDTRRRAILLRLGISPVAARKEGKEVVMSRNVNDIIDKRKPAQRKKVETRAAQLIANETPLRELRRARKLTQVRVARSLGITQDGVSRLEKRSDILLSTLRKTVAAMGGNLSFPKRSGSPSELAENTLTRTPSARPLIVLG